MVVRVAYNSSSKKIYEGRIFKVKRSKERIMKSISEKGEIEVHVEIKGIDFETGEGRLQFSVRDTGIGISKENQQKIFEAFFKQDSSATRKYGGTGLGLTISSRLLRLMNSKLELESEKEKGSKFYFTLPVKLEEGKKQEWD